MRIPDLKTVWQDHDNVDWFSNSTIVKVKGLMPYTKYQVSIHPGFFILNRLVILSYSTSVSIVLNLS